MAWILLAISVVALVIMQLSRIADVRRAAKAAEEAKRSSADSERRFQQKIDGLTGELANPRPFNTSGTDATEATTVLCVEVRQILDNAKRAAESSRAAIEGRAGFAQISAS
ncbi:hypothetical protein [Tahibacter aquaticus]|uniref:hypothetical protein n=1 Tax=Tahibacter aquaticus TaxID=520092 RepID=UPI0010620EE2|nr:hypothetical protein [Tahibacter aquaticus]